ncbi:MAG: toll/interleukin-1 receptor domain-containing protein, partial [Flammeovirgaceae bacterium]
EEIQLAQGRKIFLSHKSEDKKMVRRFQRALEAIGYEVWLDEKNLQAGDPLERSIFNGFKESCAAVFFITDNFKDEKYLKAEIDYAIVQTREKENYFKIITLAFKSGAGNVAIPELLRSFVWKKPATELDALIEIMKALPLVPRQFDFK